MKKLIKTAPDAKGDMLNIYWQNSLVGCPALPSFLRVYAEIIENGFANGSVTWTNKNRVIWAENNNKVVGGITYEYYEESKTGWIVLSFTEPEYRGRRINEIIHYSLEEDLKKLGGVKISSLVHINNESRLKSADRVGLKPQFYRMNKPLV